MSVKSVVSNIHRKMYKNKIGYFINVFLLTSGIREQLKYLLYLRKNEKKIKASELANNKAFFESNKERTCNIIRVLADEKSKQVYKAVINYRCDGQKLEKWCYSLHDQYFVKDIIKLCDDEVFVDCGGYVGDTTQALIGLAKKEKTRIKKSIVFEPQKELYEIAADHFKNSKIVSVYNKGVYSKKDELFLMTERLGESKIVSHIEKNDVERLHVVSIDSFEKCLDSTFIKMDIEGAEMDALKGAEKTILRNYPKLAICIYHSNEDMLRIIEYIHSTFPKYKLYVRHHSRVGNETVLYCVK